MPVEQCDECGFDGARWADPDAVSALGDLPDRWTAAIAGLSDGALTRRPIDGMWSIAEYTDHVRETIFGMRFLVDTALDGSGTDLGKPPAPRFDIAPRKLDTSRALAGFNAEVRTLEDQLRQTPASSWKKAWVLLDGERVDLAWIVRHALHDVTHHIGDIRRLVAALG